MILAHAATKGKATLASKVKAGVDNLADDVKAEFKLQWIEKKKERKKERPIYDPKSGELVAGVNRHDRSMIESVYTSKQTNKQLL